MDKYKPRLQPFAYLKAINESSMTLRTEYDENTGRSIVCIENWNSFTEEFDKIVSPSIEECIDSSIFSHMRNIPELKKSGNSPKQIFKCPLLVDLSIDEITLPEESVFLSLQVQQNRPVMWFLCDTTQKIEVRTFHTIMTGCEFDANHKQYIGTYDLHMGSGMYVGHIFEEISSRIKA